MVLGHSAAGQSILLAGGFAVSRWHLEDLLTIDDPNAERLPVHWTGSHPLLTQGVLAIGLQCLGFPDQGAKRPSPTRGDWPNQPIWPLAWRSARSMPRSPAIRRA
jgi:hypothetical protein